MSILFRTQKCLTILQLTRAWGLEIAKGGGEPEQHVHDLTHILVCTENSIRVDYVTESPNVSGDDRPVLPLPGPVRLAVQVEEPT
jgi:hypothetical protein